MTRAPSLLAPCLAGFAVRVGAYAVCAGFLAAYSPFPNRESVDVRVYLADARAVAAGVLPYKREFVEYPPVYFLAVLPPYPIALACGGEGAYPWCFAIWMGVWEALLVWLVGRAAWEAWGDEGRARLAAWCYALSFACAGFATTRFDALPAAFAMAALLAAMLGRGTGSAALAATGALAKWFPGVLIAPLLLEVRRRPREASARVGAWAAMLAVGTVPIVVLSLRGFLETYRYHFHRVANSETTHKLLAELGERTGWWHLSPDAFTYPLLAGMIACWLAVAVWLWRRPTPWPARTHAAAAVAILVPFLLGNKAFSPQFLLWVAAPFCVMARARLDRVLYFALQGAMVIEFPLLYCYYPAPFWLGVTMGVRCLLLAALALRALGAAAA